MTKQILLKTPRGNTAVIPVDRFVANNSRAAAMANANTNTVVGAHPILAFSAGEERAASSSSSHHGYHSEEQGDTEAAAIASALDTSRIFEDDYEDCDADRRGKEELLFHLIGASKRRDVGRKRTLRSLYNLEVEDEDDGTQMEMDTDENHCHPHRNDSSSDCSDGDEEQKAVATRFDAMNLHRDRYYHDGFGGISAKSRRRFYSSATNANRRLQRKDPSALALPRPPQDGQQGLPSRPSGPTTAAASSTSSSSPPLMVAFYHQGRKISLDRIWNWITGSSATNPDPEASSSSCSAATSIPQFPLYLTLSTSARLLGGIDRQNRVGSKFGGGGVSSSQNSERERKERLKQLALESIDLAKDPYLMRNHLGTYECKLCLTLHTNEANYLAHTQGKKHQAGLAKRAYMEKLRKEREDQQADRHSLKRPPPGGRFGVCPIARKVPKIGRPAYQVFKSKDPATNQRCLTFELTYKDIETDLQPRHRFMSAFEQKVDLPRDKRYQYVLFAAEPYETIAFKIPNEPLDRDPGRLITHWDGDHKTFTVTLYFADGNAGDGDGAAASATGSESKGVVDMDTDGAASPSASAAGAASTTTTPTFAAALGSR